jgi:hypothetical protein
MRIIALILIMLSSISSVSAQKLKPYILGLETTESIAEIKAKLETNLVQNQISIAGQYQPASDNNRWIIVFSSPELESSVQKIGGLTGFAAALRIAITSEKGITMVTYTNPVYWGNAYFRDDFDKVSSNYAKLALELENAMKASGTFIGTTFGSEEGMTADELREYHYMMGMPYFDDTVELKEFESYQVAVTKMETSIKEGVANLKLIYKITIPGKDLTLYGFALSGPTGEENFLPIVDLNSPKHTAFLPYEVLVTGKEVHMLHGRFRIALSFPDLTMGTFSKIMSTPGDIEDLLEQLVD